MNKTIISKSDLPEFVRLSGTDSALRYRARSNRYYSDLGRWSTGYKNTPEGLKASYCIADHVNGRQLIRITREQWEEANKGLLKKEN